MTTLLDYAKYREALQKYFAQPDQRAQRMVGAFRQVDSEYSDIVRFFGPQGVNLDHVRIARAERQFEFHDGKVKRYTEAVERLLIQEGRLYAGPLATKLVDIDWRAREPFAVIQRCRYGDQAGSCFALDRENALFDGATLREYYLSHYPDRSVRSNPLAICWGVCGMLLLRDDQGWTVVSVHRSGRLASLEESWGPTVAGSVDWSAEYETLAQMAECSLKQEALEEIGLRAEDYDLIPLAYGREIFRGERPQLFYALRVRLVQTRIEELVKEAIHRTGEFDDYRLMRLHDGRLTETQIALLNHEARATYYLLEEWLATETPR